MSDKVILLVEDNLKDEALTLRALSNCNILNEVIAARDGLEALDYLFCKGAHADRDSNVMPEMVLLDLKLLKLDGFEVLERIRGDKRTRHLPVIIFTSSDDEVDLVNSYGMGANSYIRKPVDFEHFLVAAKQLGLYWLSVNLTASPIE